MARRQSTGRRIGVTVLAWAVAFVIFFPILWTFLTSFKTELDAFAIPPKFLFFHWTLENYVEVQNRSNYLLFAYNSIVLSIGANVVGLIIAVPAAWSMAFAPTLAPTRADAHLYAIILAPSRRGVILFVVGDARYDGRVYARSCRRGVAGRLLDHHAAHHRRADVDAVDQDDARRRRAGADLPVVPRLHLLDSRFGVGLMLLLMNLPILIWMLYTYFKEIPVDILEAARMDGASLLNEIIHVLTPMAVPGIASTMLLAIILSWNEAFWTLNLTSHDAAPLTAFIASYSAPEGLFWAKLSAASTLAIAPILILGWFSQKQLVRGLTFGAVK